ncbi:BrnT family toxin [Bartonella schoenbuchensis]|uniref:BrnT family toxin n=2 Tax=Bartonella schoenbuchensis TaxID=165694 RepID=E6Z0X5_BARSR|nr:BrnT family toxin [Bartonella schoenbuchensis]AQX31157.1 hypothetical protein BscR1v2_012430 [Bartonella schoenbuchensis R1]CBI82763.1 conserved hypothetical protein [Bartonella schoenbuchensis R1]CDP80411.1 hypothetical protein BN1046_01343 [Bartonella schoenbuchensis]
MKIRFEWDKIKAESNLRKHRISFEVAVRVFADPLAMTRQDRIENGEYRWQTLGLVNGFLLLLVAHTIYDDKDGREVIRIISARRASLKERKRYEEESSL